MRDCCIQIRFPCLDILPVRVNCNSVQQSGKLSPTKVRGGTSGRILSQVQDKEGNPQPQSGDAEERQNSDPGNLRRLWDESVPDG